MSVQQWKRASANLGCGMFVNKPVFLPTCLFYMWMGDLLKKLFLGTHHVFYLMSLTPKTIPVLINLGDSNYTVLTFHWGYAVRIACVKCGCNEVCGLWPCNVCQKPCQCLKSFQCKDNYFHPWFIVVRGIGNIKNNNYYISAKWWGQNLKKSKLYSLF